MRWLDRIRQAERRGYFSKDDSMAAARWPTCLVGEFFGRKNWPEDSRHTLISIGKDFFAAVVRDDFRDVRKLYLEVLGVKGAKVEKLSG